MNYKDAVVTQAQILNHAEDLKVKIWVFLERVGEPPFDIKGTMNLLLDEIESLEFDHLENKE